MILEVCYRIQYPEPNRRHNGDPFSTRQTGLYVNHTVDGAPDVWILVTPNEYMMEQLRRLLSGTSEQATSDDPELPAVHQLFLGNLGAFWDEYIEVLRSRLESLVSRTTSW